jgi:ankyrin repeat protein
MTRKLLNWKSGLASLQDASGSTPLHYAASVGNLETVNILLEHLQNANILLDHEKSAAYVADEEGLYPIHVAAKCGRTSVIKKLMEVFPDSDELVDKEGKNFLHIAIISGKEKIITHIPRKHTLFNARDNDGNTPLHLASKSGYLKFVSSLISFKEVCSSIRNKDGLTPLDLALTETHPGFMHRLVQIRTFLSFPFFILVYTFFLFLIEEHPQLLLVNKKTALS